MRDIDHCSEVAVSQTSEIVDIVCFVQHVLLLFFFQYANVIITLLFLPFLFSSCSSSFSSSFLDSASSFNVYSCNDFDTIVW